MTAREDVKSHWLHLFGLLMVLFMFLKGTFILAPFELKSLFPGAFSIATVQSWMSFAQGLFQTDTNLRLQIIFGEKLKVKFAENNFNSLDQGGLLQHKFEGYEHKMPYDIR